MITFDPADTGFPYTKHTIHRQLTRVQQFTPQQEQLRKGCHKLMKRALEKGYVIRFFWDRDRTKVERFTFWKLGRMTEPDVFECGTFTEAYKFIDSG